MCVIFNLTLINCNYYVSTYINEQVKLPDSKTESFLWKYPQAK